MNMYRQRGIAQLIALAALACSACGGRGGKNDDLDGGVPDGQAVEITYEEVVIGPPPGASDVNRSVATDFYEATRFLYEGATPVQTGVVPGTILRERVGVVRGRLLEGDGTPLAGAVVTIVGHGEFGQTLTRDDGGFDMAVNGGVRLTAQFVLPGRLTAHRTLLIPIWDYGWLPDVRLIAPDGQSSAVDPAGGAGARVALASATSDGDGDRQPLLLFVPGTTATLQLPGGTTEVLAPPFHVRATEYTVGPGGREAMPAELPPASGYTYAVELSVDEAEDRGAEHVVFDPAVVLYLENFLGFPVGSAVPAGFYSPGNEAWVPSENGRVVEILSTSAGLAELDLSGGGSPATPAELAAMGITDEERAELAGRYQAGQTLWRVNVRHFSPWDCNWPFGMPWDALPPRLKFFLGYTRKRRCSDPCKRCGSIIECQNQVLGEAVPVVGTPWSLHYKSDRVTGRREARTLDFQVSESTVPASLKRIDLEIEVAGRKFVAELPPLPDQRHSFQWDGLDAYGRLLQGAQPVAMGVGYVYDGEYQNPMDAGNAFGASSGVTITGSLTREEVTLWQRMRGTLGSWDALGLGLGGWSLSLHHAYDPTARTLYLGDGGEVTAAALPPLIETIAGTGQSGYNGDNLPAVGAQLSLPAGLAVGPDGSLFVADEINNRVRRIAPDGQITTVAGNGTMCDAMADPSCGDGGLAVDAAVSSPHSLALAPDGSLYIAEIWRPRIRRVDPSGTITTVAGGTNAFCNEPGCGDGGPAVDASFGYIPGDMIFIALGPDGTLYVSDQGNRRVRRIGLDGNIYPYAGGNSGDYPLNYGVAAIEARLVKPAAIAVGPDGSVYIPDESGCQVARVGPDGILHHFAGHVDGIPAYGGDGGPATEAQLNRPTAVVFDQKGNAFLLDRDNGRVRKITPNGIITTVAGSGDECSSYPDCGGGGSAPQADLSLNESLALGLDGTLYFSDMRNHVIRRLRPVLPGASISGFIVPSARGARLYRFDAQGRHQQTLNGQTQAVLHEFGYDPEGRLVSVTDGVGHVTTVERDATGAPTAILGPFGHRTTLTLDASGYLATVTNPASETQQFEYGPDGLLTRMVNPNSGEYLFEYDEAGRLIRDTGPEGGYQSLAISETEDGFTVQTTTADGQEQSCTLDFHSDGGERREATFPSGVQKEELRHADGSREIIYPDGTTATVRLGPDPLWGLQTAMPEELIVTTPGGLRLALATTMLATLAQPGDPLSLQTYVEMVDLNGRLFTSTYDAAGRQWTHETAMGRRRFTTMDHLGRVVSDQAEGLEAVRITYRTDGLPETVAAGAGVQERIYQFSYDTQGNLIGVTDPLLRTTTFEHDAAGRVLRQVLPDRREIAFTYDALGNVTSITPPGRSAHHFSYSSAGQQSSYTPPPAGGASADTRFAYNSSRQLVQVDRPDGSTLDFTYDAAGRLAEASLPRGAITYGYNAQTGTLQTVTAPGGDVISYSYDGLLLTEMAWSGTVTGSVQLGYDDDFRVSSVAVNGTSSITYGYDGDGLLEVAGAMTLNRHATHGRITGTTLGSVTTTRLDNAFGELASYEARYGGTALYTVTFTRDLLGRVTGKTEFLDSQTTSYEYVYDRDELATVRIGGVVSAEYVYDDNGNRLSFTDAGGTVTGTYDEQDRLVSYGGATYTYSANGELQEISAGGDTTQLDYGAAGALLGATLPDGTRVDYILDGMSRRIGKRVDGVLVQGFVYQDALRPVAELNGNGTVVSRFVYASRSNVPSYLVQGGATYRIIADHLGSPRLVVNVDTGQVVQRLDYGAFGQVLLDTNPGFQPFGFAGGLYDRHTGLVRFGARDYDPVTGRWTTKDPIGFGGRDPNLYGYVLGDPINQVDPSGLVVDTIVDVISIGYGVYRVFKDNIFGNCDNLGTNLNALGLDITGALIPGVTGLGTVSRVARRARIVGRGGAAPVRQGAAGVNRAVVDLESAGGRVLGREITVEAGGVRTRMDLFVELPSGQQVFMEVKTGRCARLTRNQRRAFPKIWEEGGVPWGANAVDAYLNPGKSIVPIPVWTVHYPWPLP